VLSLLHEAERVDQLCEVVKALHWGWGQHACLDVPCHLFEALLDPWVKISDHVIERDGLIHHIRPGRLHLLCGPDPTLTDLHEPTTLPQQVQG